MSSRLPHLPETMFHKIYTPFEILGGDDLSKIIDKLARDPRIRTNDEWTLWPSRPGQIEPVDLQTFIRNIACVAADFLPPALYHYVSMPHRSPMENNTAHMPGLVLTKQTTNREHIGWSDVLVAWEIRSTVKLRSALNRLAHYAQSIFGAQPHRRYVIGFRLVGRKVTLWVFDRSGAASSEPIHVHEQPLLFLRLILGTLYADNQTLGLDPSIFTKDGRSDKYMTVSGVEYKVKTIYTTQTILGRGTVCYQGEVKVDNVSRFVAIKDSWVDVCRDETEPQILEHLNSGPEESLCTPDGVRVIPKMIHHEIVKIKVTNDKGIEEEVDDTTAILRAKVVKGNPQFVIADAVKKSGTRTEPKKYEIRAHSRIVTEPFGKEIQMFTSLRGLVRAFCDIFHAIRILYEKGVLHRDISMRNVLLHEYKGELRGLLIDYDQSVFIDKALSSAVVEHTGMLPFMAIDRLANRPEFAHNYFHDLESVLYIICWICAMYAGPENTSRRFTSYYDNRVGFWNGKKGGIASMDSVWAAKMQTVYLESDFIPTLMHLAPYFKPLLSSLKEMRRQILDPPVFNQNFRLHLLDIKKNLDAKLDESIEEDSDDAALDALAKEYLQTNIQWRPARLVFRSLQNLMEDALRNIPDDHELGEARQRVQGEVSNRDAAAVLLQVEDVCVEAPKAFDVSKECLAKRKIMEEGVQTSETKRFSFYGRGAYYMH